MRGPLLHLTTSPRAPIPIAALDTIVGAPLGAVAASVSHEPLSFGVLYAFCDLCIPLNIGLAPMAGALYPFGTALAVVLMGSVVAATAAFFIARLFRVQVEAWLDGMPNVHRRFEFVDRAITRGGFRAVLLLRLIPTPVPALNFLYGLTRVRGPSYVLATALGNLPGSVAVLSSAALAKHVVLARGAIARSPLRASLLGVVAALAICGLGARVLEAAKTALEEMAGEGRAGSEDGVVVPVAPMLAAAAAATEGCVLDEHLPTLSSSEAAYSVPELTS